MRTLTLRTGMTKSIGIGGSNFRELIDKNLLFVDKTLFIKEVIEDESKVRLITRPRRWGKTLNMSMLHYFFSPEVDGQKTEGLFDKLLISKEPENYIAKHQGKYPVIFLSLKDVKQLNFNSAITSIILLIQDIYSQHRYLLNSPTLADDEQHFFKQILTDNLPTEKISASLRKLSEFLYRHFKQKVYILIDEYDTPLNFARGQEYFDHIALFMKNFLGATLKDNNYLEKGVLTGILRISKDSMLSGLNNLEVYTTLYDPLYAPYFGFTDQELDPLFADQNLVKNEGQVKAWYNGYCINGLTLYNPWSIMSCLKNKARLGSYWLDTGNDDLLKELLLQATPVVKTQLQQLVEGNAVTVTVNKTMRFDQVNTDQTMLWNLLISAGYLKVLDTQYQNEESSVECSVAIPNREVLGVYHGIFLRWLTIDQTMEARAFIHLLAIGRVQEFATAIESFLKIAASVHDYAHQPEAFYHGLMLALTVSLIDKYFILSNREGGLGRPDLVIIPKDTTQTLAVILEFKTVTDKQTLEQRAQEGLQQIQARDYSAIIAPYDHIQTISSVGMAFDGKQVLCLEKLGNKL